MSSAKRMDFVGVNEGVATQDGSELPEKKFKTGPATASDGSRSSCQPDFAAIWEVAVQFFNDYPLGDGVQPLLLTLRSTSSGMVAGIPRGALIDVVSAQCSSGFPQRLKTSAKAFRVIYFVSIVGELFAPLILARGPTLASARALAVAAEVACGRLSFLLLRAEPARSACRHQQMSFSQTRFCSVVG